MSAAPLRLEAPGGAALELLEVGVAVDRGDATSSSLLTARPTPAGVAHFAALDLDVEARAVARDRAAATLEMAVCNRGARPRRVESVELVFRARLRAAGALRFLRNGWQSWSFTGTRELDDAGEEPFPSGAWLRGIYHAVGAPAPRWAGWHESETFALIGPARGGPVCLIGALESGRTCAVVHLRRDSGGPADREEIRVAVEQRLEVDIKSGERRSLESIYVELADAAGALLERYAEAWGRAAGARRSAPYQTGWCSWYHFFHGVGEDDVRRNLEAMAAAVDEIPVAVVQIDDGYQSAMGDWLCTNDKFPRGLAPLAAEIRAAGFIAGLWTAPFAASAESALLRAHPDWTLGDAHGDGTPLRGMYNPAWSADGWVYSLDAGRDDVLRHLEETYRALAAMGFAYQKLDFLYMAAQEGVARDRGLTRAARLRGGLAAIRRGAGGDAFLLGCGCPLGPAIGVVDGMRIGPDVAPSWEPDSALAIPGLENVLPSTHSALRSTLHRLFLHRRLWLNDPDCLMARSAETRLQRHEVRSLATAVAACGGVMVFSDDVAALDGEARRLIRAVIDCGRTLDGAANAHLLEPLAADDGVRAVAAEVDGATVIAAINLGDTPAALPPGAAPPPGARDLLAAAAPIDAPLAAHASVLWRLAD